RSAQALHRRRRQDAPHRRCLVQPLPPAPAQHKGDRRGRERSAIARHRRGGEPPPRPEGSDEAARVRAREERIEMTNKGKETQDVIVRLLTNIGSRKEVEQYLRHYASVDAPKFAVVKVSGAIIDRSLDALASSMSFLQRVG